MKLLDYKDREAELETHPNPFAAVTLAHLKAIETRGNIATRAVWKLRLVKGLYKRGFNREQVNRLFRLIDWMIRLPVASEQTFLEELDRFEKEQAMPFMCPAEEIWLNRGRLEGIEQLLTLRFGTSGLELMPQLREVESSELLETIMKAIRSAPDIEAIRALLTLPS